MELGVMGLQFFMTWLVHFRELDMWSKAYLHRPASMQQSQRSKSD